MSITKVLKAWILQLKYWSGFIYYWKKIQTLVRAYEYVLVLTLLFSFSLPTLILNENRRYITCIGRVLLV